MDGGGDVRESGGEVREGRGEGKEKPVPWAQLEYKPFLYSS